MDKRYPEGKIKYSSISPIPDKVNEVEEKIVRKKGSNRVLLPEIRLPGS